MCSLGNLAPIPHRQELVDDSSTGQDRGADERRPLTNTDHEQCHWDAQAQPPWRRRRHGHDVQGYRAVTNQGLGRVGISRTVLPLQLQWPTPRDRTARDQQDQHHPGIPQQLHRGRTSFPRCRHVLRHSDRQHRHRRQEQRAAQNCAATSHGLQ